MLISLLLLPSVLFAGWQVGHREKGGTGKEGLKGFLHREERERGWEGGGGGEERLWLISRSLHRGHLKRRCSPGHRVGCRPRCTWSCGWCSTPPALGAALCAAPPLWCSSGSNGVNVCMAGENSTPDPPMPNAASWAILTLSEARILKEAITCSAVSVSAVSRVMKSIKAWKVTTPVLLASTRVMMRANSTSPCWLRRMTLNVTLHWWNSCRGGCTRGTDQIVTHGDEAGAEVIWVHHAVSLLQKMFVVTLGVYFNPPPQPKISLCCTLSKWLKEALNSLSCSWLMPFASRVRIWFSTSLMVLAMVVSSCSQPTRMCYRGREERKK